jgi:hypothetical protein
MGTVASKHGVTGLTELPLLNTPSPAFASTLFVLERSERQYSMGGMVAQ